MTAMPICESIDSAKLWVKTSGSTAKMSATASQNAIRRAVSTLPALAPCGSGRISMLVSTSTLPRPHQPARTHDQHQHHQQIRQNRCGLRNRDRPHAVPSPPRGDMHTDLAQYVEHRIIERDRERLYRADNQRRQEGAGERAHAAENHDEIGRASCRERV